MRLRPCRLGGTSQHERKTSRRWGVPGGLSRRRSSKGSFMSRTIADNFGTFKTEPELR